MDFAKRLKSIREHANLSQKEVADKVGLSAQAYNNYEKRGYNPTPELLIKLANALNIDVNTLVGFKKKRDDLQYIRTVLSQADIVVISVTKTEDDDDFLITYEHEDGIRSNLCLMSTALKIINKCEAAAEKEKSLLFNSKIEEEFFRYDSFLFLPEEKRENAIKYIKEHSNQFMDVMIKLSKLPPEEQEKFLESLNTDYKLKE